MDYKKSTLVVSQLNLFDEMNEVSSIENDANKSVPINSIEICSHHLDSFQNEQDNELDLIENRSSELVSINSLEVCSYYLNSLQNKQDINDTKNALVRYFVPAVEGPVPSAKKHKMISSEEVQAAFNFLKTVPLTVLADSPDIALRLLNELNSSPSQQIRVRRNLKDMIDWARKHNYLAPPENPIPEGVCAHIKVGLFKGLDLKPANARQILERYLEHINEREAELDVTNALIRFFVPGCDGPIAYHKPPLDYETEAALKYLETVPLEYLSEAPDIAAAALKAFDISMTHATRIRNALRSLIKWAISEQYLPKPNSVAPWGGECLPQETLNLEIAAEVENRKTLFEFYQEYCQFLEQSTRTTEINSLQTAVVRYFVPSCGGPVPRHLRATANEIQSGLDYLKTVPLDHLSNAVELAESEFERLDTPSSKRSPIRSRLRGWVNWFTEQYDSRVADEGQAPQPVFNTFYTNGVRREPKKVGMHLYKNSCPAHALCAKQFPDDYINDYLKKQLDTYKEWRRANDVTPGSLKTEEGQILQLLGWLHRYEGVPLDELRFDSMISKKNLIFWIADYENHYEYLKQKESGIQEARKQADKDQERTKRYLEFVGENPNSKARRLFIVLSIARFLYRDVLGSDDYPEDRDIPILRRLLDIQAALTKKGKIAPQTMKYSETSTSWEQAVMAMEKERLRAEQVVIYIKNRTRKGYKTQKRPDTALANTLQSFLSIAFCILVPSRARTFYELRIGETFKEGILTKAGFSSVEDLKNRGMWEQYKNSIKFYIHHTTKDFKVGKSMTPALHESEGWWAEIPNISFGSTCLYDYIRRWLEWGRTTLGPVSHNFFFRQAHSSSPMDSGDWNARIKKIFGRWTGVPVPPKNIRKMFTSEFPEHKESAALLLQHSERVHMTHYDMRQTVEKMQPVMEANKHFISEVLSDLKANNSTAQANAILNFDEFDEDERFET